MSYMQLSEGVSRWFTPSACGPGSPELSKSDSDMASKLFTFTFTQTHNLSALTRTQDTYQDTGHRSGHRSV